MYEQIRWQVTEMIASGELSPGMQLPTVRALAADLGIAVNTVGRAYSELEAAGLVRSARRHGTVVADGAFRADPAVVRQARRLVRAAQDAGLEADTVLALVRGAWLRADPPDVTTPGG